MEDAASYSVGSEVEFLYHASLLCGIVGHIETRSDGKFLVGFEYRTAIRLPPWHRGSAFSEPDGYSSQFAPNPDLPP
jgi:hypothetical protein